MTAFSQPERRALKRSQKAPESHPDADLLTAFAEHSLTSREQEQVLGHLAVCATCRDLVALAGSPLVEPVPEPLRQRASWEMSLFHWGAVAATTVVVVAAVSLGVHERRSSPALRTLNEIRPAATLQKEDQVVAEPKAVQPAPEASASAMANTAPGIAPNAAGSPVVTQHRVHLQQEVRYERAPESSAKKTAESTNAQKSVSANGAPAAVPAAAPGSSRDAVSVQSNAVSLMNEKQNANINANLDDARARAEASASAAPRKDLAAFSANQPAAKTMRAANVSSAQAVPQPQAPPAAGSGAINVRAPHMLNGKVFAVPAAAPTAQWQVTKTGQLQRSVDHGGSWENVLPQQKFRTVAGIGDRVWAGGDDGVFYTSPDSGRTWKPVAVSSGNTVLTGNIVQVHFADAQHGSLQTSTGENWATIDGGQSWVKQ